jgi:hypothetical protein
MDSNACPFWKGIYVFSCKADERAYYPSQFEINEYCNTAIYKFCPFYKKTIERNSYVERFEKGQEQEIVSW